jgi:ankyrin repeat protein
MNKYKPYDIKDHINKKTNNNHNIETLFNLIQSGEYEKVKNILSHKNIPFNAINNSGKTVIHLVIEDDINNIEEEQKYDLIRFFIENNAPVSLPDQYNITPLHLACKYHYKKIVKLLLDNGADINAVDNNNMNVLHYLCQGYLTECKPNKPVTDLIPNKSIKKNIPFQFENLMNMIITVLKSDKYNTYMNNIKNSLNDIFIIFKNELTDEEKKILQLISGVTSNMNLSNNERIQKINEKCDEYKDTVIKIIKKGLANSLKREDIKPGYVDGWKPNNVSTYILADDYKTCNIFCQK